MNSSTRGILAAGLAIGGLVLVPRPASAQSESEEPWFLSLQAGLTGPMNDPVTDLFSVGPDISFGVYRSIVPAFAIGARVRSGFLSEGEQIPQEPVDRDLLDYGMLSAPLRVRPLSGLMDENRRATGLWLEAAPGLSIVDGHVLPAYEAAIGYNIEAGPIAIGPHFRFTHFIETEGRFGDNHILSWLGGVEVAFLDEARNDYHANAAGAQGPRPVQSQVAEGSDRDADWILDDTDQCPDQPEVYNGLEDSDGCPDEGRGTFMNDALVVDERVFFEYDSSTLRDAGREQLEEIVDHYNQHGDRYSRLVIGGHADSRGPLPYNEDLSRQRAQAVMVYLQSRGIPEDVVDIRAYGETQPAVPNAETEAEHRTNRRVEFRVTWRDGQQPEAAPEAAQARTVPEYVEESGEPQRTRRERRQTRAASAE